MSTPSVRFYQFPFGDRLQPVDLVDPITTDGIVIFRSSKLNLIPSANNTSINLFGADGSIILCVAMRRVEDVIVLNSRTASGTWLVEQRIRFSGSFDGQNHTITVYDHGDRYQVLTNGTTRIYYDKQLKGDVTAIDYSVYAGETSIFSDNLAVETYNNFAALVPGCTWGRVFAFKSLSTVCLFPFLQQLAYEYFWFLIWYAYKVRLNPVRQKFSLRKKEKRFLVSERKIANMFSQYEYEYVYPFPHSLTVAVSTIDISWLAILSWCSSLLHCICLDLSNFASFPRRLFKSTIFLTVFVQLFWIWECHVCFLCLLTDDSVCDQHKYLAS